MTSLVAQKKRRFLLQRTLALLLVAALLAVPAASAKTVSVEVPWEKARTIIAEGDFRPKIRVELQSSERLKGKLAGTTDAGLRLKSRGTETSIAREEIRTIRLRPRKFHRLPVRVARPVPAARTAHHSSANRRRPPGTPRPPERDPTRSSPRG